MAASRSGSQHFVWLMAAASPVVDGSLITKTSGAYVTGIAGTLLGLGGLERGSATGGEAAVDGGSAQCPEVHHWVRVADNPPA